MVDIKKNSCQQKSFFFHTSGRSNLFWIHTKQKQFLKDFFLQNSSRYLSKGALQSSTLQKEMRSIHTLIGKTNTFIYPQYRVLLRIFFSKINELFCNYKDTVYVLGTIHTLFYLVVFIFQQFYVMYQFLHVQSS